MKAIAIVILPFAILGAVIEMINGRGWSCAIAAFVALVALTQALK